MDFQAKRRAFPISISAAALAGAVFVTAAPAQDSAKPKPEPSPDSEIARYCGALAPSASEARAAYQLRRLDDLQREVRDEVEKLEAKESAARDWVKKRQDMMRAAADDVVAIYSKMAPEAAAPQLSAMDEPIAAAVLAKLKPQTASAILGEMVAEKAAKLSTLMGGAAGDDRS